MTRLRSGPRLTGLAVLAAAVVLGCGPAGVPAPVDPALRAPATIAQLIGPWQPVPYALDPALRAAAERTCRRDMEAPAGTSLAVVDARGASVVSVMLAGPGGTGAGCDGLHLMANGSLVGASGGWSGTGMIDPVQDGLRVNGASAVGGGDLQVRGWTVSGTAGGGIVAVVVEVPGRPAIAASFEKGFFQAWWPRNAGEPDPLNGQPSPPFLVVGYDAGGRVVAESTGPR